MRNMVISRLPVHPMRSMQNIPLEVDPFTTEIHLDGGSSTTWGNAKLIGDFWEKFPTDRR